MTTPQERIRQAEAAIKQDAVNIKLANADLKSLFKEAVIVAYQQGVAETEARYKALVEAVRQLDHNMGNIQTAGWVKLRSILAALSEAPDA